MEDFTRAEQKCRCINNISGCWLLECLMCITSFFLFYCKMALHTLLGSSDLILSSQSVSGKHTALGVGVQMFRIIQDQALKLRHLNTSTYFTVVLQQASLQSVQHYWNLFAVSDSGSSSDHPRSFFLLCLEWCLHVVSDQTTGGILTCLC